MAPIEDDAVQGDIPSIYQIEEPSVKPRKRRRRPLVITGIVVGAIILIAVAVAAYFYLNFYFKVHAANNRVDEQTQQVLDTPPVTTLVPSTTVPQNGSGTVTTVDAEPPEDLVILGSDVRPNQGDSNGRSDVIEIVHIDRQQNYISFLSVTRDLWVSIPGHGENRINAAYSFGGAALTISTIKQTFGLNITKYMEVGFDSFAKIVDSVGGVYVDVDRRYSRSADNSIDLAPGFQLLDGANALTYSRFRYDENADFGRMTRQQRVMSSLRDQISGTDLATKMPGVVNTLLDYSATNLGANELLGLGMWMAKLDGSRIKTVMIRSTGTMIDGKSVIVVDKATLTKAVTELLTAPGTTSTTTSAAQVPGDDSQVLTATNGAVQVAAAGDAVRLALTTNAVTTVPESAKWKSAQVDVPFALQAPAYLPEGYSYSDKMPVGKGTYGIKVGDETKPAVCMVFRNAGTTECMRVTATTWVDAPLARAGGQVAKDGVTYTVVGTSGGADRVWWTKDGVLYCVSNSLMHTLTKQELLKVAESMVPVAGLQ